MQLKEKISEAVSSVMNELTDISKSLYENPELGYEEFKSSRLLGDFFKIHGFELDMGIYNIETAFKAMYNSSKDGPKIAFLCEYDALPGIGHGCGHNLISSISLGAAVGLKSIIDQIGGTIVIFGTPAEETSGAKVALARQGAFSNIDAAMIVHPSPVTEESGSSLALTAVQFEYFGKSSHAAASPEKGINALEAAILTYNNINSLRQYVTSDVKIHGIIKEGGKAANIIPDYAAVQFYVRAAKNKYRDEVADRVINCAKAASDAVGTKLKVSYFEEPYDDLNTNKTLSKLFNQNLLALGESEIRSASASFGSVDMGNVSQVVPAIHPWLGIGDSDLALHTKEFADYTQTENGKNTIYKGACAMAMTAFDVIVSKEIQNEIKEEFEKGRQG